MASAFPSNLNIIVRDSAGRRGFCDPILASRTSILRCQNVLKNRRFSDELSPRAGHPEAAVFSQVAR